MSETLMTPSSIRLFGRIVDGLTLDPKKIGGALGANKLLHQQLSAPDAALARIYGFSFEGHQYDLPKPALFLVHGKGKPVPKSGEGADTATKTPDGLRVWEYDKADFSLRLDVTSGSLEQILLEANAPGGGQPSGGGAGYNVGYNVGYNAGYNVGYNVGLGAPES